MAQPAETFIVETRDPNGKRVIVAAAMWWDKVLRDHPELRSHLADVVRAIGEPDHITADPASADRRRHYLRDAGPSRWLLVVLSYEQVPARLITAFPNRKDPVSWRR